MSAAWVALGGALGALARWGFGLCLARWASSWPSPWATLAVNVLGCFAMGCLLTRAESWDVAPAWFRPLLVTGFLGGFTTFSAFGWETAELARTAGAPFAALNAALQLGLGLGAVCAGRVLVCALR